MQRTGRAKSPLRKTSPWFLACFINESTRAWIDFAVAEPREKSWVIGAVETRMAWSSGTTDAHRRCTDRTVVVHRDAVVAACSTFARESRSIGIEYSRNGHGTATSGYTGYAANFDQEEGMAD